MPLHAAGYVGRTTELAVLRQFLAGARAGRGGAAFLIGESGIGKSRLAAQVAADAVADGVRVLRGRTGEFGAAVPFRPIAEVLLEGSVFENVDAVSRLSTCAETTDRGLMNAPPDSNEYLDATVFFVGGDGTEPHDTVFVPPYDYEVEPAADALARVTGRAGAGGRWPLPLSVD